MCIICYTETLYDPETKEEYIRLDKQEDNFVITCPKLTYIPNILGITSLRCEKCPKLIEVRKNDQIRLLQIYSCASLEKIEEMPMLKMINVKDCPNLVSIGDLPELKVFGSTNCVNLIELPNMEKVKQIYCNNTGVIEVNINENMFEAILTNCKNLQMINKPLGVFIEAQIEFDGSPLEKKYIKWREYNLRSADPNLRMLGEDTLGNKETFLDLMTRAKLKRFDNLVTLTKHIKRNVRDQTNGMGGAMQGIIDMNALSNVWKYQDFSSVPYVTPYPKPLARSPRRSPNSKN